MATEWVDRCLIKNPYYVAVCLSERDFRKSMKKMGITDIPQWINEGADATVHTFENQKVGTHQSRLCAIVCLTNFEDRTPEEVIGLIVHEAVHIWQEAKISLGEKYPSSEFMAYSIQNITMNLIEGYNKAKVKYDERKAKVKIY